MNTLHEINESCEQKFDNLKNDLINVKKDIKNLFRKTDKLDTLNEVLIELKILTSQQAEAIANIYKQIEERDKIMEKRMEQRDKAILDNSKVLVQITEAIKNLNTKQEDMEEDIKELNTKIQKQNEDTSISLKEIILPILIAILTAVLGFFLGKGGM